MENKLLFIGAIGAFFLAVGATFVSDMHGIGDWFVSSMQIRGLPLSPAQIYSAPYSLAGYIGEPLLMISIALFTTGFYGSWLKYHKVISLLVVAVGVLYLLERVFWSYVTINFSRAIQAWPVIQDYSVLTTPGLWKGIGALLGGIIGGLVFSTLITVFFFSIDNIYGKIGGLVVIITMLIGMPVKILFMNNVSFPIVAVFITSMVVKNFGIVFMGVGLLTESLKCRAPDMGPVGLRNCLTPVRKRVIIHATSNGRLRDANAVAPANPASRGSGDQRRGGDGPPG